MTSLLSPQRRSLAPSTCPRCRRPRRTPVARSRILPHWRGGVDVLNAGGALKRDARGAVLRDSRGAVLRYADDEDETCCCETVCAELCDNGASEYTLTVTSAITICTGCRTDFVSNSINATTTSIPAGTSWCLETLDPSFPCAWQFREDPAGGILSGFKYFSSTTCGGGFAQALRVTAQAARSGGTATVVIWADEGLAYQIFGRSMAVAAGDCVDKVYTNAQTSCPATPFAVLGGGGTVSLSPGCEEGI